MKTSQAITGFIADDPRLTYGQDATPRFYARVAIKHYEQNDAGRFRRVANSYHDMVQFGRAAELSYERFSRGDDFIAQGQVRDYTREVDGAARTEEQFLARRVSHDPNTTTYTVQRAPSAGRGAASQQAPQRETTVEQVAPQQPVAQQQPAAQAPSAQQAPQQQVNQPYPFEDAVEQSPPSFQHQGGPAQIPPAGYQGVQYAQQQSPAPTRQTQLGEPGPVAPSQQSQSQQISR